MKKITLALVLICVICACLFSQQSYYVSANGNNNNDGLSEETALRSLSLAYQKASAGNIKRIMVIGRIGDWSEEAGNNEFIFDLRSGNDAEILITGDPGANRTSSRAAALTGSRSEKSILAVRGRTRIEHLWIYGGEMSNENQDGIKVFSVLTQGPGVEIGDLGGIGVSIERGGTYSLFGNTHPGRGSDVGFNNGCRRGSIVNRGTFIFHSGFLKGFSSRIPHPIVHNSGTFIMNGGTIGHHTNSENGGGVYNMGTFTMNGGSIRLNRSSKNGGGVYNSGTFTLNNGSVSSNTAEEDGGAIFNAGILLIANGHINGNNARNGGGVFSAAFRRDASFTMTGGDFAHNKAAEDGGGVYISFGLTTENVFSMSGGRIWTNTANNYGGGVYVAGVRQDLVNTIVGGIFTQSGGDIFANTAKLGGGILVMRYNGRYDRTGGTVRDNRTTHVSDEAIQGSNSNVFRARGALGAGW
ncbi:MAG: hypothetical protein FWD26_07215 [Treponema sp.]|nr:hypothetical protein [Treponema sp.]